MLAQSPNIKSFINSMMKDNRSWAATMLPVTSGQLLMYAVRLERLHDDEGCLDVFHQMYNAVGTTTNATATDNWEGTAVLQLESDDDPSFIAQWMDNLNRRWIYYERRLDFAAGNPSVTVSILFAVFFARDTAVIQTATGILNHTARS